ncbi:hypothetical protein BT63DRAFT_417780 [Microthyrium microscopicum]|uniref:BHLH domain-containing protein n=1 Tax=Microthyrium microscopicum TaxID=703497 RepID=A0A6A6TZZ1_9PEZI|nr:hypothetical protein BT63DRAFT_417780 [Microthyrium microscopicum]
MSTMPHEPQSPSATQSASSPQQTAHLSTSNKCKRPGPRLQRDTSTRRRQTNYLSIQPLLQQQQVLRKEHDAPEKKTAQHGAALEELTSKSNYQFIADGSHSQLGLSFPDEIVLSVHSKRENHSAAEQARRDRLKSAFLEMSAVLAGKGQESRIDVNRSRAVHTKDGNPGIINKDKDAATFQKVVPKAKLVEMAIDRINTQQKELEELRRSLDNCQRRMEKCQE